MKNAIIKGSIVGLGVLLQIGISLFFYLFLIESIWIINIFYTILRIFLVLGLIKNSKNYSFTLPWIILLLLFPLVGTLIYVIIGNNKKKSKLLKAIVKSEAECKKYYKINDIIREEIKGKSHLQYIQNFAGFPITKRNNVNYYPLGEEVYKAILEELKKAEKFIFIEYFIIARGVMWNSILEILEQKVKMGVLVRVIYDDAGCISKMDYRYPEELRKKGIEVVVFNKLNPISGVIMNNRDHRKILVIDGRIAFSGGINLADEYINVNSPYGHWKDNGIRVEGEAVWNYSVMFLTLWRACTKCDEDFEKYHIKEFSGIEEQGYVVPYAETPLDEEIISEDIYLNIINQANHYVYICTPYLIIDTTMLNALVLAAKRGVHVCIIIPNIPDKKIVYTVSESYLESLILGGVHVYKYTPGFIHAKVFIADDNIATVGSINLDYRSLYLHFECGLYMENHSCIKQIKQDVEETINASHEVTKEEATPKFLKGLWQAILRLFAPLM